MNDTSTSAEFPSKVDAWLIGVVLLAIAAVLYQATNLYATAPAQSLFTLGVTVAMVLLMRAIAWPCRYVLMDDHLLVIAGRIRQRIPYAEITAVEPSWNPLSAPALSLRRVKVSFGRRYQLISPVDRERFVAELGDRVAAARNRGPSSDAVSVCTITSRSAAK